MEIYDTLVVSFKGGLQPQEVRLFRWGDRPVYVHNIGEWCVVYVNGQSYVQFHAEAESWGWR